jgi:hypothetical protein
MHLLTPSTSQFERFKTRSYLHLHIASPEPVLYVFINVLGMMGLMTALFHLLHGHRSRWRYCGTLYLVQLTTHRHRMTPSQNAPFWIPYHYPLLSYYPLTALRLPRFDTLQHRMGSTQQRHANDIPSSSSCPLQMFKHPYRRLRWSTKPIAIPLEWPGTPL